MILCTHACCGIPRERRVRVCARVFEPTRVEIETRVKFKRGEGRMRRVA